MESLNVDGLMMALVEQDRRREGNAICDLLTLMDQRSISSLTRWRSIICNQWLIQTHEVGSVANVLVGLPDITAQISDCFRVTAVSPNLFLSCAAAMAMADPSHWLSHYGHRTKIEVLTIYDGIVDEAGIAVQIPADVPLLSTSFKMLALDAALDAALDLIVTRHSETEIIVKPRNGGLDTETYIHPPFLLIGTIETLS